MKTTIYALIQTVNIILVLVTTSEVPHNLTPWECLFSFHSNACSYCVKEWCSNSPRDIHMHSGEQMDLCIIRNTVNRTQLYIYYLSLYTSQQRRQESLDNECSLQNALGRLKDTTKLTASGHQLQWIFYREVSICVLPSLVSLNKMVFWKKNERLMG